MRYIYVILLLTSLFPISVCGQHTALEEPIVESILNPVQGDSIVSNSFSSSFYQSRNILERNYDFEVYNKQRKLLMWSSEVRILGYASLLGIIGLGSWLAVDNNWPLWATIPTEVILGGGICVASNIWANNIKKKANAISESTLSVMRINQKSNLCLTHYSMDGNINMGFGVGYKYNF